MFAEKTMEASAITGTGSYQLGTPVGAFKTWRSRFADLSPVFYCAENGDGTIWEIGYGTLTYGSPDTISRSVLASSTGSAIAWAVADAPVYVFSAPLATWMKHMALGGRATARPAWLPRGGGWLDESDVGAWSTTRAIDYASVQEMVAAMNTAGGQLDAFVRFVEADTVLVDALRRQDWHAFAGRYNGPGQVDHYAGRIAQGYARQGGE